MTMTELMIILITMIVISNIRNNKIANNDNIDGNNSYNK